MDQTQPMTGSSQGSARRRAAAGGFVGPEVHPTGDSDRTSTGPLPGFGGASGSSAGGAWPTSDEQTVISPAASFPPPSPILTGQEWAEALVGQTLGHYHLQAIVGAGGMGAVFRGHDQALDKIVAVKVLLPSCGDDEELLRRFKNEAQSAARLDHPHAARVYYVGEERSLHYIVYEFIEGRNIRDLVIDFGLLSIEEAVRYTYQIADTLAHAAARDVVHRDIKPSNVLVTPEGSAKVVDMGLARLHQVEHTDGDLTASGVTLGTFDFISPEQARDPRTADVRSDIYSLGCTLFFMLAGRPPFSTGTVLQKLLQHESDAPPDIREFRSDVPEDLAGFVQKMLAKKPEQRYQTPAALMADLAGFAQRNGLKSIQSSGAVLIVAAPSRPIAWARHMPWILAAVLLLLAVVALEMLSRHGAGTVQLEPVPVLRASTASADPTEKSRPIAAGDPAKNRPLAAKIGSNSDGNASRTTASDTAAKAPPRDKPPVDRDSTIANDKATTDADSANDGNPDDGFPDGSGEDALDTPLDKPGVASTDQSAPASVQRAETAASRGAPLRTAFGKSSAGATMGDGNTAGASAAESTSTARLTADSDAPAVGASAESRDTVTVFVDKAVDQPAAPDSYPTLARAYAAASAQRRATGASSIRIMLRVNGALETKPLVIDETKLTIAAAEGYAPVLSFKPASADPEVHARSMFRIVAGQLTLDGVHIELTLPDAPSERWNVFEAQDAELIRLRDGSVTIRPGATAAAQSAVSQSAVSVLEVASKKPADSMVMPQAARPMTMLAVRLDRTIIRGDATMLRLKSPQAVRLTWNNGLAVLGRPMLAVEGASQQVGGAHFKATVNHVTAALGGGLLDVTNAQDAPFLPTVELECYDNIFIGDEQPLVAQQGVDSVEDFRDRLRFKGERNFYEGWSTLWRVHGVGFEGAPEEFSFRDWAAYWGRNEALATPPGAVIWGSPISLARPPHEQRPGDFALANVETNPAHGNAEKGADAGATFDQLPTLPNLGQPVEAAVMPGEKSASHDPAAEAPSGARGTNPPALMPEPR